MKYYVAIEKSTGNYFNWEHDSDFNIIGNTTEDISKAVHYEDGEHLESILKETKNIDFNNFEVVELSGCSGDCCGCECED